MIIFEKTLLLLTFNNCYFSCTKIRSYVCKTFWWCVLMFSEIRLVGSATSLWTARPSVCKKYCLRRKYDSSELFIGYCSCKNTRQEFCD